MDARQQRLPDEITLILGTIRLCKRRKRTEQAVKPTLPNSMLYQRLELRS